MSIAFHYRQMLITGARFRGGRPRGDPVELESHGNTEIASLSMLMTEISEEIP